MWDIAVVFVNQYRCQLFSRLHPHPTVTGGCKPVALAAGWPGCARQIDNIEITV